MSRGKWSAATKAKWADAVEASERNGYGASPVKVHAIEHWKDKRVHQRAKAKRRTEDLLTSILWRVASQNRKDALARGAPRYIGTPCDRHDNAERYTATGHCVICAREYADVKRARRGRTASSRPRMARPLRKVATRPPPIRTRLGRGPFNSAPVLEGEGEDG